MIIGYFSTALFSLMVAFYKGWHLALTITLIIPFYAKASSKIFTGFAAMAKVTMMAYAKAGGIADQCFRLFKTIVCNNQQEKEIKKYNEALENASEKVIKQGFSLGLSMGLIGFVRCILYGFGFLAGAYFLVNSYSSPWTGEKYLVGDILTIFFLISISSSQMGQMITSL